MVSGVGLPQGVTRKATRHIFKAHAVTRRPSQRLAWSDRLVLLTHSLTDVGAWPRLQRASRVPPRPCPPPPRPPRIVHPAVPGARGHTPSAEVYCPPRSPGFPAPSLLPSLTKARLLIVQVGAAQVASAVIAAVAGKRTAARLGLGMRIPAAPGQALLRRVAPRLPALPASAYTGRLASAASSAGAATTALARRGSMTFRPPPPRLAVGAVTAAGTACAAAHTELTLLQVPPPPPLPRFLACSWHDHLSRFIAWDSCCGCMRHRTCPAICELPCAVLMFALVIHTTGSAVSRRCTSV